MEVVDAHLHLFKAVSEDYPRTVYPGMADAEMEVLAEELLGVMGTAGVDKAIVVPSDRRTNIYETFRSTFLDVLSELATRSGFKRHCRGLRPADRSQRHPRNSRQWSRRQRFHCRRPGNIRIVSAISGNGRPWTKGLVLF